MRESILKYDKKYSVGSETQFCVFSGYFNSLVFVFKVEMF